MRARYESTFNDDRAFWQEGGLYQAHSYSATANVQACDQPAFTTYDPSLGVAKDAWLVQISGENVTDARCVGSSTPINSSRSISLVVRRRLD